MNEQNFAGFGRLAVVFAVLLALGVVGCQPGSREPIKEDDRIREARELSPPDESIKNLAFLAGTWVQADARTGVPYNEEHWMLPRGSSVLGMVRRMKKDGTPAFHELTSITKEDEGVFLRLRHFHTKLDAPERESDIALFRLVTSRSSSVGGSAEFVGVSGTLGVSRVVYTRVDDTLKLMVWFDPGSPRTMDEFSYIRSPGTR